MLLSFYLYFSVLFFFKQIAEYALFSFIMGNTLDFFYETWYTKQVAERKKFDEKSYWGVAKW